MRCGGCLRIGLAMAAVAALWALPSAAGASPHRSKPFSGECPVGHVILNVSYSCAREFTVQGTNGYSITVSGEGRSGSGRGGGEIEISVKSRDADVVYLGRGTFTPTGMNASFGHLGKLSVRFRPSGKVSRVRVPKKCLKERPPIAMARLGTFVGSFRFRGKRGYTEVSAHRMRGGIGDPLAIEGGKPECEWHATAAEKKEEEESIQLTASSKASGVSFSAAPLFGSWGGKRSARFKGDDLFIASQSERAKGVQLILRVVAAAGPPDDFVFDTALTSATVTPPSPFTGSASFQRNADGSTSWTGSLSVPVPGLGTVGLTEPGYQSELATVAQQVKQAEIQFIH